MAPNRELYEAVRHIADRCPSPVFALGETAVEAIRGGQASVGLKFVTFAGPEAFTRIPVDSRDGRIAYFRVGRVVASLTRLDGLNDLERYARQQTLVIDGVVTHLDGRLFADPLQGLEDLARNQLTAPAEVAFHSLAASPSEILRVLRLAETLRQEQQIRFGSKLYQAVRQFASRLGSPGHVEAVRDEFVACLLHPRRAEIVRGLQRTGVLNYFLPEVAQLVRCVPGSNYHGDANVLEHSLSALAALPSDASLEEGLATLGHDIGKLPVRVFNRQNYPTFRDHEFVGADMMLQILRRMRFPVDVVDPVVSAIWVHMALKAGRELPTVLQEFMVLALPPDLFRTALTVHDADIAGREKGVKPAVSNRDYFAQRYDATRRRNPVLPRHLIDGAFVRSSNLAETYRRIGEAIISGQIRNPEQWVATNLAPVSTSMEREAIA